MLPLSNLNDIYIEETLKHLQKNNYVLIPISHESEKNILINELEAQLKSLSFIPYRFNLTEQADKGLSAFYSHIIATISKNRISPLDKPAGFVQKLSQCEIKQKTVLIFDLIQIKPDKLSDSFYEHFFNACMEIDKKRFEKNTSFSNILIVFLIPNVHHTNLKHSIFTDSNKDNPNIKLIESDDIKRNLSNKLINAQSLDEFCEKFKEIISGIFNIKDWKVFSVINKNNEKRLGKEDPYLKDNSTPDIEWLDFHKKVFIDKVLLSENPLEPFFMDETKQWFGMCFRLKDGFERLIIGDVHCINSCDKEAFLWFLSDTLQLRVHNAALMIKKVSKQIKQAEKEKDSKTKPAQKPRDAIFQILWDAIRTIIPNEIAFTFYEVFIIRIDNEPVYYCLKSDSKDKKLSNEDIKAPLELIPIAQKAENFIQHCIEDNNLYVYVQLINKTTIICKFRSGYKGIKSNIKDIFSGIGHTIDSILKTQDIVPRAILHDEYAYIMDRGKRIIFASNKMKELYNKDSNIQCFDFFNRKANYCNVCPFEIVKKSEKEYQRLIKTEGTTKPKSMYAKYKPMIAGEGFIGMAVIWRDMTERQLLLDSLEKMRGLNDVDKIEKEFFENLHRFGFEQIYKFAPSPVKEEEGWYISENYKSKNRDELLESFDIDSCDIYDELIEYTHYMHKKLSFINGKKKFFEPELVLETNLSVWANSVWTKKNIAQNTIDYISGRLGTIDEPSFKLKDNSERRLKKPMLWINLPVFVEGRIYKLYSLDNNGNIEKDQDRITFDRLSLLSMFARATGQFIENAEKRRYEYIDRFHSMMSHSINEPLQMIRWGISKLIPLPKYHSDIQLIHTIPALLEQVQSILRTLIVLEKKGSIVKVQKVDIKHILKYPIKLSKIYANHYSINLQIIYKPFKVMFKTDGTILLLILNNLIGNAIRYTKKSKNKENRKIQIEIEKKVEKIGATLEILVINTGMEVPETVSDYFSKPWKIGMSYPTNGFGIGFSREMADLINPTTSVKGFLPT